jgi:hypothetical protein
MFLDKEEELNLLLKYVGVGRAVLRGSGVSLPVDET